MYRIRSFGAEPAYPTACDAAVAVDPKYAAMLPIWIDAYANGGDAARKVVQHDCEAIAQDKSTRTWLWVTSGVAAAALVGLALKWR